LRATETLGTIPGPPRRMDEERPLHERVAALERAVTDGHADDGLPDAGRMATRVDDIETTVEELDDRMAELDAAVQALRGFAGGVRAVDEEIERRANAAISRVDRLEAELESVAAELPAEGASVAESEMDEPRDGMVGGRRADARDGTTAGRVGESHGDGDGDGDSDGDSDDTDIGTVTSTRDETLREEVTARSDAALAEAVASDEQFRGESQEDPSLADRIRRLL
jgi:hypothetical protein